MSNSHREKLTPEDLPLPSSQDEWLRAEETAIMKYAEAERGKLELRDIDKLYWARMDDGRIIQVEAEAYDDRPAQWSSLEYDICHLFQRAGLPFATPEPDAGSGRFAEESNHQPSLKEPAKKRGILSWLGIAKTPPTVPVTPTEEDATVVSAKELSVKHDAEHDHPVLTYGTQPIQLWFQDVEVIDGVAHGKARFGHYGVKVSILNDEDIARTVELRERYEQLKKMLDDYRFKGDMISALRRVGSRVLADSGASDIRLDVGEGVTYRTYGIPTNTTFDFKIGARRANIFATPSSLSVTMGDSSADDAFQLGYGLRNKALDLLIADDMPMSTLVDDPFSKLEEARDFPETVQRAFEAGGFRNFDVEYTRLTDALPLIMRLLQAPITDNHEVLTPYFYGLHEPRRRLVVTGPDTLSAISWDDHETRYRVGADGILVEELLGV